TVSDASSKILNFSDIPNAAIEITVVPFDDITATTVQDALEELKAEIDSIDVGNSFSTILVSGQSNVEADSVGDSFRLVAGSNMTITTNAGTDSITLNSTSIGSVSSDTSPTL